MSLSNAGQATLLHCPAQAVTSFSQMAIYPSQSSSILEPQTGKRE